MYKRCNNIDFAQNDANIIRSHKSAHHRLLVRKSLKEVNLQNVKIPSEMEVAPRYNC